MPELYSNIEEQAKRNNCNVSAWPGVTSAKYPAKIFEGRVNKFGNLTKRK
jgi:hypothetical protein